MLGESWWQLATAVVLGIAFTQIAFLGHDAGHKQIFRTRRGSYILGLLHGNLALGLSLTPHVGTSDQQTTRARTSDATWPTNGPDTRPRPPRDHALDIRAQRREP